MVVMKNVSLIGHIIGGIVIVAVLFFVLQSPRQIVVNTSEAEQLSRLSVSGEAQLAVPADEAVIFFRIESQHFDPKVAQDEASGVGERAVSALRQAGVAKNDIETTDYSLQKLREWNPEKQRTEDKGYIASHTLKVKTKDLLRVGVFLKVAVDAGVNKVQNIEFSLSKEKQREVKSAVLSAAAKQAGEKAEALAAGLGVRLGNVVSVSESGFYFTPVYRGVAKEMIAMDAAAPPIQPGEVSSQASVSVVYQIS